MDFSHSNFIIDSFLLTFFEKKVSKETLNTICKLLNCQPGDILEYVETEE